MKIAVDAAAICQVKEERFGNYTFTRSLIEALGAYDKDNEYLLYSFCKKPFYLNLEKNMRYRRLMPKKFWLTFRVSLEEAIRRNDVFLALNQAIPRFTHAKVLSFCHGLSYFLYKDLYPDSYENLRAQLFRMIDRSKRVLVSSRKVKGELASIFYDPKNVEILPYGVPYDFTNFKSEPFAQPGIKSKRFFLYVGLDHPIKNIQFLKDAFTIFLKHEKFQDYKLVLAANFERQIKKEKNIVYIRSVTRRQLKKLYQSATGYLTASLYESFNFPVLEALSQDCPVIGLESAIIPEMGKFVYLSKNVDEFAEEMRRIATSRKSKIESGEVRELFSWRTYVEKLTTW